MFNLQIFAGENNPISGKNIVYLYRVLDDAATDNGLALAFTSENEKSASKDADSTATKDGTIRTPGQAEIEISATSFLSKSAELYDKLYAAMLEDKLVEVWEANLEQPGVGSNKFKGTYYQAYLTEVKLSSSSDDFAEVELTFGVNGVGAKGDVTVSKEQQAIAQYEFKDTTPTGA